MMFGGYGVQGSDPKLGEKLAALKRSRKSPDDVVHDFLTRDIGVDPDSLPLTPIQVREYLSDRMNAADWDTIRFNGTSMQLVSVVSSGYDSETDAAGEDHPDWPKLTKAYTALCSEYPDRYSFCVSRAGMGVEITGIEPPPPRHTDLTKYPTGTVLRIGKQRLNGDDLVFDRQYIRIGGLFDDVTPTNLDTLQPIPDPSSWIVCEEL